MRTVVYARFSSHLQNRRSIDDQVRVCRERADREGWTIVDIFTDYAISGAAGIGEEHRPGLNALLARVEAGGVDQVLAESTDRIARHIGDSHAIRERIIYAGARLFTLNDGEVNDMTAAFKGLIDSQFRKELAAKIKRGQSGTIADGRSPAGLAYGYRKANRLNGNGELIRGLREIDEDQAEVVRSIFRDFANGQSTRQIAERLNRDRVPSPSGGTWRASTIHGDRIRQNGMLQNRLYVGEIVHNRTRKIVDPKTRRTRIKPNPESEWISTAAPALRIVDDETWERVQQQRQRYDGQRIDFCRRPKHFLSGLVYCGVCGGGFTVRGGGYWGCGRYADGRGCTNNRSIKTETLEHRILNGLEGRMLDPEIVSAYVREFHRDMARRTAQLQKERAGLEKRLAEATAKVNRLVEAIATGADEFVEIREILATARAERTAATEELAAIEAMPVITLHPKIAADYRQQVAALSVALSDEVSRAEAMPIVRSLIDRVTCVPAEKGRGVAIDFEGRLANILALATGQAVTTEPLTVMGERVKGIEPSS
ncbi:recombinase family protein [Sphingomonas sp. ID0503]|uniref:recombinase family protein n=1 Tax=Sphingomonas sp. ID0503 TaxID=3399691 RepID=UPI003AFB5940